MKKSRIFMTLGAFALVVAGVFASKANKKYAAYSGEVYIGASHTPLTATSCLTFGSSINTIKGTLITLSLFAKRAYGFTSSYVTLFY